MNRRKNEIERLKNGSALLISVAILLAIGIVTVGSVIVKRGMNSRTGDGNKNVQNREQNQNEQDLEKKRIEMGGALSFDQSGKVVAVGEKFSIQAMLDPKTKKATAAELYFIFDPEVLKLDEVIPSNVFSLSLSGAKINNKEGTASITVAVPLESKVADSFSPVVTLKFEALSASSKTEISFANQSGVAARDEAADIITSKIPAVIKVQ